MAKTVSIVHDFSSIGQKVIAVWYKNANPAVEIGRTVLNTPHIAGDVLIVPNLQPVIYLFKFYQSTDGVALQTLLSSWAIDASKEEGTAVEFWHYTVGGNGQYDPAPDQDTLTDPRLAGLKYLAFSRGTGPRTESEIEYLTEGGFRLINGELLNDEDTWTVLITRTVQTSLPGGGSSDSQYNEIFEVEESGDFDATWYNRDNVAAFSTPNGVTVFPSFASLPDGRARFSAFTGNQRYWKLQFSGDTIRYKGKDRSYIQLATDEWVEIAFKAGKGYVLNGHTRYDMVGEKIMVNNKNMIGTALCDGSGMEHNISDWQRLIDELPAEMSVTYPEWDLHVDKRIGAITYQNPQGQTITEGGITKRYYYNRGKFAVNEISGKFKFPDGRGWVFRSLKNFDGSVDSEMLSQGAGGLWAQEILKHAHTEDIAPNNSSAGSLQYGRGGAPLVQDGITRETGGNENRMDSEGKYIVVII